MRLSCLSSSYHLLKQRQDELAAGSSFVTEHIGVSLLDVLHRVFLVDDRRQEAHFHACYNGSRRFTPLLLQKDTEAGGLVTRLFNFVIVQMK